MSYSSTSTSPSRCLVTIAVDLNRCQSPPAPSQRLSIVHEPSRQSKSRALERWVTGLKLTPSRLWRREPPALASGSTTGLAGAVNRFVDRRMVPIEGDPSADFTPALRPLDGRTDGRTAGDP